MSSLAIKPKNCWKTWNLITARENKKPLGTDTEEDISCSTDSFEDVAQVSHMSIMFINTGYFVLVGSDLRF